MTTNWEKHFGSPEKVAKTLESEEWCPVDVTKDYRSWEDCKYRPCGSIRCDDFIINWLQEECDESR